MYSANEVAAYILNRCIKDERYINIHQLSHIIYLLAEDTVNNKTPLFNAMFEYGRFGPICPEVYYEYYYHGMNAITTMEYKIMNYLPHEKEIPEIDRVIFKYRANSLGQLSEKTTFPDNFYSQKKKEYDTHPQIKNSFFTVEQMRDSCKKKRKRW